MTTPMTFNEYVSIHYPGHPEDLDYDQALEDLDQYQDLQVTYLTDGEDHLEADVQEWHDLVNRCVFFLYHYADDLLMGRL